jgi:hypothetical protein
VTQVPSISFPQCCTCTVAPRPVVPSRSISPPSTAPYGSPICVLTLPSSDILLHHAPSRPILPLSYPQPTNCRPQPCSLFPFHHFAVAPVSQSIQGPTIGSLQQVIPPADATLLKENWVPCHRLDRWAQLNRHTAEGLGLVPEREENGTEP